MLRYISSFFWKSEDENDDLSLEESCNILHENSMQDLTEENDTNSIGEDSFRENNFSINTGIITEKNKEFYVIDEQYQFESDVDFNIGTKVSYHKFYSNGKINIYNVKRFDSDWDAVETNNSIWTTRILVRQVESRQERIFKLNPGGISLDLDKVVTEFIPIVGDWLEIEAKCVVNENSIDLSGEIIEIDKISPLRRHIEQGRVTLWDSLEKCGSINQKIYFNNESLSCGYIPVVGDKIICEIIESERNKYTWRALKVIPEFIAKNVSDIAGLVTKKVEENHPGLIISEVELTFSKLNETSQFKVNISTESEEIFVLTHAEFLKSNGQCKVLENIETNLNITKEKSYDVLCECTVKNIGISSEYLLLKFEDFSIGRWLKINGGLKNTNSSTLYKKKPFDNNYQTSNNQIIRGERSSAPNRFVKFQIPPYNVPNHLLNIVSKYKPNETFLLVEELRIAKPSLFSNLQQINYEDKFHSLLHLDEIANMIAMRNYDQERVCFIENGEYLMLEIENLAERRPSIVLGDKIIATDPLGVNKIDYEGLVHKVGAKHVYLKFSGLFHDKYKGEDYTVRVVAGRANYKRLHHAVYLASRNLGRDLLFPTKIIEKQPQTNFVYDKYSKSIDISEDSCRKSGVLSPKEVLRRMLQNKEKANPNQDPSMPKLEWYNSKLNCKQKDAIINILKGVGRPLPYIIFGPPGTGKTVTVIETILQIVRHIPSSRLLVTAPSNSAADLIALRLINSNILKPGDLVRLVSINYALGDNIPAKLVPFCATGSVARDGTAEENVLRDGITYDCSREVLGRHRITVSTCSSAGQLFQVGFPKGHFTHVVVDEAGQAMEPEVMIPISFLDKYSGQIVLAGDPMQLGPVILSNVAQECGLQESYLERLTAKFPYIRDVDGFPESEGYDPRIVTKLLYNYRSLKPILQLFSDIFYNGDLIATISSTNSDESHLLESLSSILPKTIENMTPSIVFHAVNGENYQSADSPSWYNPHEASQVFFYVNELYRLGLKPENIGIVTPYVKQVKEIRTLLREAEFDLPKVGTVEEVQGQEFDVILLSTVRSTSEFIQSDVEHSLGFVSSPRRLNVAISRPKSLLVIIGNPKLLQHDTYWRTIIKYCFEKGGYTGCDLDCC